MASLVEGFEYDLFISYRHNDNRSGWVTEFVNALQEELSATIKEPLSIYFDKNPHDGLLETHHVNKSLEGKLKCLIFIPIISQTYCDPKSFAWTHEFCAFNKLAKADRLGRDIKLSNGNVASRILPIKIHDLDNEDKATIEAEIEGVLRPIEFIFKSAGVNRSLRITEEHPQDNLNKTFYRDQVNKVANAIKELIHNLKSSVNIKQPAHEYAPQAPRSKSKTYLLAAVFTLLIATIGYLFYQTQTGKTTVEDNSEKSIAVLPFANLSNDPDQEYFSDGITEQIITNLAHINSLKVIARTSVMKFKGSNKSIAEIGKELNVTHVLEGSIRKSNDRVRVTAQLIAVKDESHVWAQDYDRELSDIFTVQDEVSIGIASQLQRQLTPLDYEIIKGERPANVAAYQAFLKANSLHQNVYYVKRLKEDYLRSEKEFLEAIELDPDFGPSYAGLADLYDTYSNFGSQSAEEKLEFQMLRDSVVDIAMKLSPNDQYTLSVKAYTFSNKSDKKPTDVDSTFMYRRKAYQISPNDVGVCDALSIDYGAQGLYFQAIQLRERAISLDPTFGTYYGNLASLYLRLGEFEKCEKAINKALLLQPEDIGTLVVKASWECNVGRTTNAVSDVEKIKAINPRGCPGWLDNWVSALTAASHGDKEKALSLDTTWRVRLSLGMTKEALDAMEKETNKGFLHYLSMKNSPFYDPLRSDARFQKILEREKVVYELRLKKYAN